MKTITARTNERSAEVPTKWAGKALAVHRPIIGFGTQLSTRKCSWTITHIESGFSAGRFEGPLHDAIKLAKAWDSVFLEELSGVKPDARNWSRKDQWLRQLHGHEVIASPTSLDALVAEYA